MAIPSPAAVFAGGSATLVDVCVEVGGSDVRSGAVTVALPAVVATVTVVVVEPPSVSVGTDIVDTEMGSEGTEIVVGSRPPLADAV